MNSIKKYLPVKEETAPVQVYMSESLIKQLKEKLKKQNITLKEFFIAAAKSYIDEK